MSYDPGVHVVLNLKTIFDVTMVIFTSMMYSLGVSCHYPGLL